jgi:hypothetical protein
MDICDSGEGIHDSMAVKNCEKKLHHYRGQGEEGGLIVR